MFAYNWLNKKKLLDVSLLHVLIKKRKLLDVSLPFVK